MRSHVIVEIVVVPDAQQDSYHAYEDEKEAADIWHYIENILFFVVQDCAIQIHLDVYVHLNKVVFLLGSRRKRLDLESRISIAVLRAFHIL